MKKSKKQDFVQMDITAALRGHDVIYEEKTQVEKEIKEKDLAPWDFANDILFYKKGNMLDSERGEKAFQPFIVLRYLSMYLNNPSNNDRDGVAYVLCLFDRCGSLLSKKHIYNGLMTMLSKRKYQFNKYVSNKEEDLAPEVKRIAEQFECSIKEAKEYMHVMGSEWVEDIKKKYGDLI